MVAYKDFFDAVETTPLTAEQRRAAVVMEDRNLLVASAGSGKTSTVVGKVGYVLLGELATPDEVLVVVVLQLGELLRRQRRDRRSTR